MMELSFFREPITLTETMGTDESQKNISIYPNPTSDFLNIKTENIKVKSSTIYDLSGKQIFSTQDSSIDVGFLPSGVYVIVIKTENGEKTFKWIKR